MAFYDRMADTATRLLTKFGKSVTFERVTSVFNPITGMDTSRTTATTDTVGVEIPINQALIDGTRVQSDDKFIVIDASFKPMMSDRLIYGLNPPVVSCAYPMDATSGDAIALGNPRIVGAMVASGEGKTATYTIQSAHATVDGYFANYVQFNAPFPTTVDLSTGKKVIEGVIGVPATLSGGTGGAAIGCRISTAAGASIVFLIARLGANGSTAFEIFNGAMAFVSVPGVVYPATVGVTFDAVAGTFAIKINGAEIDVSSINTYTPQAAVIEVLGGESTVPIAVDAADAGKTLSFTLHSSVDDITQTYASGTTDICGNTLAQDVSDSWAIVAIEPINPAGTPVAYRVQVRK